MNPIQRERVANLFAEALGREPGERERWIRGAAADDPEVLAELMVLSDVGTGGFLDVPVCIPADLFDEPPERVPEHIGQYRIQRTLGRGGMGVVYLAEQPAPIRRRVAIKVIRPGMDSRQVIARFESERQALAMMSHPNIARVFDAGESDDGRPYFVMEYVEGASLMVYCDAARCDIRSRLRLFVEVCEGLQHAHQKGVIHRDVKASNVLVANFEGRAVPKLIDFGIAKAIGGDLGQTPATTRVGTIVGTLETMAPEQIDGGEAAVDTRTDVYALGVLLYELVAGALPFASAGLRVASLESAFRTIREIEPLRPSLRVIEANDRAVAEARGLGGDVPALARRLRGDLDAVVSKCLAKEPGRRYATALDLAEDIRRHLDHVPVVARPPGARYRFSKFVRRHRVGFVAACLVGAAVLLGLAGTSAGLLQARRAKRAAEIEAARARREAAIAERVTRSFTKTFELADPFVSHGNRVTARAILDAQVRGIRNKMKEDPGVKGRVLVSMGQAYRGLGLYREAAPLLEESIPLLRQAFGERSPYLDEALNELGNVANQIGDFSRARGSFEQALSIVEEIKGPEHADAAGVHKNLGDACVKLGDLDAARTHFDRALAIRTHRYGAESLPVAKVISSQVAMLLAGGSPVEAADAARRSLEIRKKVCRPGTPELGLGYFGLAEVQLDAAKPDDAAANYAVALDIFLTTLGPEHPHVGECRFALAKADLKLGARHRAYALYRAARSIAEKAYEPDDPALKDCLVAYVAFLREAGYPSEASATARRIENLAISPASTR